MIARTTPPPHHPAPPCPPNRTLLIQDADLVVTLDDARRELPGASLPVRGPQIEAICGLAGSGSAAGRQFGRLAPT